MAYLAVGDRLSHLPVACKYPATTICRLAADRFLLRYRQPLHLPNLSLGLTLTLPNPCYALVYSVQHGKLYQIPPKPASKRGRNALPKVHLTSCDTPGAHTTPSELAISALQSCHGFPEQRRDTFPAVLYLTLPPDSPPLTFIVKVTVTLPLFKPQLIP